MTPASYYPEKVLRLERENEHLREHRVLLERLLGRTLRVATAGTGVKPLALLAVLEDMEHRADRIDRLVRVLRETS